MKSVICISFAVFLSGCATKESLVVARVSRSASVSVNKIEAPAPLRASAFRFQKPSEKSSVIALDLENYKKFRVVMLELSKREREWNLRLKTANAVIETLSK